MSPQRTDAVETISSELFPLCTALKYLGRRGPWILRTRRYGCLGRPIWLWGARSREERVPRGDVLVLAAWNYPLFLPGVQAAQALAAGNRVWLKPAPGCESVTAKLASLFHQSGVPNDLLVVLPSSTQAARERIDAGVDLVVLTGSSATGRKVLAHCADKLTPAIVELSGCDAVIVGPTADLALAARAIRFGLLFNSGATCIGPRRIVVHRSIKAKLIQFLRHELEHAGTFAIHEAAIGSVTKAIDETLRRGAVSLLASTGPPDPNASMLSPLLFDNVTASDSIANADLFAPIASMIEFESDAEAIEIVNQCRYRLAASIFGRRRWANAIAVRLNVGSVTINDLLVPTADPRLPFGGRGESGFGITRGAEGLLQMTVPRVISVHRGRLHLHLRKKSTGDVDTLAGALAFTHGPIGSKWAALRRLISGVRLK